ncbi:MAG TPA: hypothetical protein VFZ34_20660 [Blastocatellia bacterium]|nr:hypothetical protein [Blastocatellia bacterium]
MATNGNNLEPEFDALLKAHIKRRDTVAVCAQFDPDSATAYLEQAMSSAAQTMFETHLSSCAVCRRHLVELSRLMPAPAIAKAPMVARATFQERLTEWFSGWRLGVMAGMGAVAATVLLVAVVVNRNTSDNAITMVAVKQSEAQATPLPAPAAATAYSTTEKQEAKPSASSSPLPNAPLMDSKDTVKNIPAAPVAGNAPSAAVAESAAPPPPPPAPAPAPSKTEEERKAIAERKEAAAVGAAASQNQGHNLRAQTPSGPASNQMQAERAMEARKRNEQVAQTTDSLSAPAPKPVAKSAELPQERQDDKRKAEAADEAAKKQPLARPAAAREKAVERDRPARPERTIAGKTFHQENGVWLDAAYETNRSLPVIRLKRDSEAYQQTLKDNPGLTPYFNLRPVVVVWQGKVYRVENK